MSVGSLNTIRRPDSRSAMVYSAKVLEVTRKKPDTKTAGLIRSYGGISWNFPVDIDYS